MKQFILTQYSEFHGFRQIQHLYKVYSYIDAVNFIKMLYLYKVYSYKRFDLNIAHKSYEGLAPVTTHNGWIIRSTVYQSIQGFSGSTAASEAVNTSIN